MKKFLGIAVVAVFVSTGLLSCKKCVTCSYEYKYLDQTVKVSFAEECGKKKDVDSFKDEKEAEAKRYGTTLTCTEE